jgi:hypothetical protein
MQRYINLLMIVIIMFFLDGCNFTPKHYYKENSKWLKNPKMENCYEIQGEYLDKSDGEKRGDWTQGSQGAWAFGFSMERLRLKDNSAKSREIYIYFDMNQTLRINYKIDGQTIDSRVFDSSQYTCDNKGVAIIISKNKYLKDYKTNIPIPGVSTAKATIFKSDNVLYVHNRLDTASMLLYIIPIIGYTEHFHTFVVKNGKDQTSGEIK